MDMNEISQDLNRRFAEPLPEFYHRRILVWKDENREFEDKLDTLVLENAKLIQLTGNNQFEAKEKIARSEKDSNILLYSPVSYDDLEDNWLLDVELYSGEPVRYDLLSSWLKEMAMESTPSVREEVKKFRSFFNATAHRKKIEAMGKIIEKSGQVRLVVLSALCGEKNPNPANVIRRILMAGTQTTENGTYNAFIKYGASDAFWELVSQVTGYNEGDESCIEHFAEHLLMSACAQTMPMEYLRGLEPYISSAYSSSCHDIIQGWLCGPDKDSFSSVAEFVEQELFLPQRFMKLEADALTDAECLSCVDDIILMKLMQDIGNQNINAALIRDIYDRRKTTVWFEHVKDYYEGILQIANMHAFFTANVKGFHTVEPEKVWNEYTENYYLMDTYYRKFHCCYTNIKMSGYENLEDGFKKVVDVAERLYTGWFLNGLGSNWSTACEADMSVYGHIPSVPQQVDFYRSRIRRDSPATVVIISDALRYEVAAELAKKLEQETHGNVKIDSCEAVFPTVTKYGMAALLPHDKFTIENRDGHLAVLADGTSTDMGYREKILQRANPNSRVVRYKDFTNMTAAERRDTLRGMSVVYLYHNTIDDAGHAGDQSKMFKECETAIHELKKLVRDIINSNVVRIIITADHGFLYTDAPLKESDKAAKSGFVKDVVELDPRYVVLNRGAKPDFLMPVQFMDGTTDYDAFAPKDSIRITSSGTKNYVHGGLSLQELVVPIIEYNHVKTSTAEYRRNKEKYKTKPVEIELLSSFRKTSNMIIPLVFFQKDAVGSNRGAATYTLFFEDSNGAVISDIQTIVADREETDVRDRQFRVVFNLKQAKYNKLEPYYLVIEDKNRKQPPVREQFEIDITFTLGNFDFFS